MHLKHGLSKTPEYKCWQQLKARCLNPNHRAYADYGGRGIQVHCPWVTSFEVFLADVGVRPTPKHSLDRYPDVNGHYAPNNVRWATDKEQNNNRRPHRKHGVKIHKPTTVNRTNFKHGMIHTVEYAAWSSMKTRCLNPNSQDYFRYGARGVTVYEPWVNDFVAFCMYMGHRPGASDSLDRFPNPEGNYEPGNVRWASKTEQNLNRRPTITGPTHGNFAHGYTGTPEYKTWGSIKTRCFNEKHDRYVSYGGAGITMCQRWKSSFPAFFEDLGSKPTSEHTILRESQDDHYSCGECVECLEKGWKLNARWATRTEVNRNRRPSTRSGKLTLEKVQDIRARLLKGETHKQLAEVFMVGVTLIGKIARREIWR